MTSRQSSQRLHGIVQVDALAEAAIYLRSLFRRYGVKIPQDSVLEDYLVESEKFSTAARDISSPSTGAARDDLAIDLGRKELTIHRLVESLRSLTRRKTPKLRERIADLANKKAGLREREQQFLECEYETFCASEITLNGTRVSFINSKQRSRFATRVEFLIKHKYPVECKRPRRPNNVIQNVKAAAKKIIERASPGLLFISLDEVVFPTDGYGEFESIQHMVERMSHFFDKFWRQQSARICAAIRGTPVVAIIFTCALLAYYHDTQTVALPTLRIAITPTGDTINENVIHHCVRLLKTQTKNKL